MTVDVVQRAVAQKDLPFFKSIQLLFEDETRDGNEFWSRVCFCNFIQRILLDKNEKHGRERPSLYDMALAAKLFPVFLEKYKPQKLLIASKNVWDWLPSSRFNYFDTDYPSGNYTHSNGRTTVTFINHPSAWRYSKEQGVDYWREKLGQAGFLE